MYCIYILFLSNNSVKTREKRDHFAAKMKYFDFSTGEFKSRKKELGKYYLNMLVNTCSMWTIDPSK